MGAKGEFVVVRKPSGLEDFSITIEGDRALNAAALLDLGDLTIKRSNRPTRIRRDSELMADAMKMLRRSNGRKEV